MLNDSNLNLPQPNFSLPDFSIPELNASQAGEEIVKAITPNIFWLAIIITILFIVIITVVLRWHWKKYSLNTNTERKMIGLYYLGSTIGAVGLIVIGILYNLKYGL